MSSSSSAAAFSSSSEMYPPRAGSKNNNNTSNGGRRKSNNNNTTMRVQLLTNHKETQIPFLFGFLSAMALRFVAKTFSRGYGLPPKQISVTDKFGKKKTIRRLQANDYEKGFVDLLKQLTVAPKMTKKRFVKRWHQMREGPEFCYVLENEEKTKILATATLMVERKFGRNLGLSGHVEDVVVDEEARDSGLGKVMIDAMSIISRNHVKCYKTILDCSAENVQFYEKCGFAPKEVQMAKYYTEDRGYGNASYSYENDNNKKKKNKSSSNDAKRNGIVKLNNGGENNGSSTSEKKKSAKRRVTYAAGTDEGFVGSPVKALNQTVYYSDDE